MEHFFGENMMILLLAGFSGLSFLKRGLHYVQVAFKKMHMPEFTKQDPNDLWRIG